jgi:non-canonical (house-cleaning) NTP pyrophosphatase
MTIGIYTSEHYFDLKKAAVEEAVKKLWPGTAITFVQAFRPSLPTQTFGFEEMFKRARECSTAALRLDTAEIGIGIENSLTFIYTTEQWYYSIGISIQTQDGRHTESFTPGIKVPSWMMEDIQKNSIKIDSLTQTLAGEDDPIIYFSDGMLTRKDLMVPTLLLAFSNLNFKKDQSAAAASTPAAPIVPQPPKNL